MLCAAEAGTPNTTSAPITGWPTTPRAETSISRTAEDASRCVRSGGPRPGALPRVASYRGFVFGSLSAEVPPLEDFLGDMRFFMDLVAIRGRGDGVLSRGRSISRTRRQLEAAARTTAWIPTPDTTHLSYMDLQARRPRREGHLESAPVRLGQTANAEGVLSRCANGHAATWLNQPEPEKRPIYPALAEIRSRIGELRAEWMLRARNTHVFPNMQIADSITLMLRTFRARGRPHRERSYCLAPSGKRPSCAPGGCAVRGFLQPRRMATPADTVTTKAARAGFGPVRFPSCQGYARGMAALGKGRTPSPGHRHPPGGERKESSTCSTRIGFHAPYREWARLVEAGVAGARRIRERAR